jgi:hypothetical protein
VRCCPYMKTATAAQGVTPSTVNQSAVFFCFGEAVEWLSVDDVAACDDGSIEFKFLLLLVVAPTRHHEILRSHNQFECMWMDACACPPRRRLLFRPRGRMSRQPRAPWCAPAKALADAFCCSMSSENMWPYHWADLFLVDSLDNGMSVQLKLTGLRRLVPTAPETPKARPVAPR